MECFRSTIEWNRAMKIDKEDSLTIYQTVSMFWGDRIQKMGFYIIKGVYDYFLIFTNRRDDDFTVMCTLPRKTARDYGENEQLSTASAVELIDKYMC